jgi:hypothetical protein
MKKEEGGSGGHLKKREVGGQCGSGSGRWWKGKEEATPIPSRKTAN